MSVRLSTTVILASTVVMSILPMHALAMNAGRAQSAAQTPAEEVKKAIDTLITRLRGRTMPEGIVKSNGRIEATEVDVAAKYPGRLATLTVDEGDEVAAGQVIGTISSPEAEAQLRGAQAQTLGAKKAMAAAEALVVQRSSDLTFARADFERGKSLLERGYISQQVVDQRRNRFEAAEAGYHAATEQRDQAQFTIKSSEADVQRYQAIVVDLTLISPRSGRVQYRLARAGEVIAPGQRILTILDLNDVYMTIYLPATDAGKLTLGDEARIIADPIPEYVFPAMISFVATDAQFTPKSVETNEERQKLMFRVKLNGDPKFLEKYHRKVKTGIRGLGFVRTSSSIAWPDALKVKLPQ
jgi:HlyD family secretion protein